MESFAVYRDIQARTKGQFLLGVVGPVRTGKSTFVRRFMEIPGFLRTVSRNALPECTICIVNIGMFW